MVDLQKLKAEILADGWIDDDEVMGIAEVLYAEGVIDRRKIDFLIELRSEAQSTCSAFENLVFQAVKEYVLRDDSIDAEQAAWLRKMLFADGKKQVLRAPRAGARMVSLAFQDLNDECLRK